MKELSYDILIKLASEIASKEKEERARQPYNANIIDNEGIRIDENAHSRILTKLLNYAGHDHSFPIYQIFIDLLKKKCCSIKNIIIRNPNIVTQEENIDILIDESSTYSIIIENKVCGAPDMETQIQRYVETVQKHNVPNENIFVIYLTRYGNKKVSDISLTPKAKNILDYDDIKLCRFIELNYKDDLLPMFISLVYQLDRDKEPLLYSSLIQYADYWKGQFDMRVGEQEIKQKIAKYMADELDINSVQDCLKISKELDSFQKALVEKQDELMKQVLNEKVVEPLKKYFGKEYEYDSAECFYIKPPKWSHYICIGEDKGGIYLGVFDSDITKVAISVFKSLDYEENRGNGFYKYIALENKKELEFWKLVDTGKVFKEIKKCVKELVSEFEGKRI